MYLNSSIQTSQETLESARWPEENFFIVSFLSHEEETIIKENDLEKEITYKALLQKKGKTDEKELTLRKEKASWASFVTDFLEAETAYSVKVKAVIQDNESAWSEAAEFTTPVFSKCCIWKECPDDVDDDMKYSVDEKNPRITTKIGFVQL